MMEKKKINVFADNSPEAILRRFEAREQWRRAQTPVEPREPQSTRLDPLVEAVVDKFYSQANKTPELSELLPRQKNGGGFGLIEETKRQPSKIVRIESLL